MSLSTFQYMMMRGLDPATVPTGTEYDQLTRTEASVLAFFIDIDSEELSRRATTAISDQRLHKLLRAIVAVKASEVTVEPLKANSWRTLAYGFSSITPVYPEMPNDQKEIKAWLENLRMLKGGVSIDIDTFKGNLLWLLPTKIHGTIPMALLLLRTILSKREKNWGTAECILNKLRFHSSQEGIDVSAEEQKEIDAFAGRIRLKDE